MLKIRIFLKIILCFLFVQNFCTAQESTELNFLILKPGDPGATTELATEYLATIANYFTSHVPALHGKHLRGWIANHPDTAAAIMKHHPPIMAYVPAGFYFKYFHEKKQPVAPIAQAPRFGKNIEHFYIVTTKSGPATLDAIKGTVVRTAFGIDWDYLRRMVFPSDFQPGIQFKLEESQNLADDLFLLIESANHKKVNTEPVALLLDEELKHFFEVDDLTWPKLKIIWTSEDLPRDLFVAIGAQWAEADRKGLFDALVKMNTDPKGKELLDLMQSSGFTRVDTPLLNRTKEKYYATQKGNH